MAYFSHLKVWKVFLTQYVIWDSISLITLMDNWHISKMAAKYRCFRWKLPILKQIIASKLWEQRQSASLVMLLAEQQPVGRYVELKQEPVSPSSD